MAEMQRPQIGDWYKSLEKGTPFQVVNVDESGDVEIQSFDGALDSIEADEWRTLALEPTARPEDWTGALEDVDQDDITEDDSDSDRSEGRS